MEEVRLADALVFVLPVVRGLPSETRAVVRAIDASSPDAVTLSVGPEELEALRRYEDADLEPETVEEQVYVAGLAAWEKPVMPPPCFTEAARVAQARGLPLEALDLDEDAYAVAYTDCVSTIELLLQGRLHARLAKKRFRAETPQGFALEWDAEVNRSAGFARLQRIREAHMAARLRDIASRHRRVLAVIEVERVKGVLAALRG